MTTPSSSARVETLRSLLIVIIIFAVYAASLCLFAEYPFGQHGEKSNPGWSIPRNLDDWKEIGSRMRSYTQENFWPSSIFYVALYIFLQTFAIPGSLMLTVIGGYLFDLGYGLFYVCLSAAIGATNCYLISAYVSKAAVECLFGARMEKWNRQLSGERKHMFNYIVFLRITPFLPNWFVNIASPHLRIPIQTFFWATFVGVAPPSFVHVQGGKALQALNSTSDLLTPVNALAMVIMALLAVFPVIARKYWSTAVEIPQDEEILIISEDETDSSSEASARGRRRIRPEYGVV